MITGNSSALSSTNTLNMERDAIVYENHAVGKDMTI